MVAGLSRRRKSQAAYAEPLQEAATEFQSASQDLAAAMDRDAASFQAVLEAQRKPKGTPEEIRRREEAVQAALRGAVEAPLEVARRSASLFDKLGQLEAVSSPSMLSDVRVARMMAATAVRGALENVAINLASVNDAAFVRQIRAEAELLAGRVTETPARAS